MTFQVVPVAEEHIDGYRTVLDREYENRICMALLLD
jgi:hypothetical protein